MKLYKLTDQKHQTYSGCQWCPGIEHTANGKGELCSRGWLHAYEHPLLAAFFNPIHVNFKNPVLWEADGDIGKRDRQLKCGCTRLRTIKIVELPQITIEQRIRAAIYCAMEVYSDKNWFNWANGWLNGKNRSAAAAAAAATYAAAAYAAYAAYAADDAAAAAVYAAYDAADAAAAAAYAADAAAAYAAVAYAAYAADDAAAADAANKNEDLDLVSIIKRAIKNEPCINVEVETK